ncbi:MAG: DUF86 domain-containing protein [Actinobacteria bacterium]|uniref:Unannotated protein n=1 Tax=freshwater metagenome TaxID=449393 RepID=A0A6J7PR30_9ZZZZ|nr:DUF86 domain-containing protein [Actinomycetota bacterium]MSW41150.1 DUF86 domain-containing protein [Actinomycetota bacterium]
MVDEVRLARLLRSASDAVASLEREQFAEDDRRADPLWLPGVKYLMITAVEACIDAAQHVCSAQKWGAPRDNADAMRQLARHGAIDGSMAEAMRLAVGFRNVLVHEYVAVDDRVVVARLQDLSDLTGYISALSAWLLDR